MIRMFEKFYIKVPKTPTLYAASSLYFIIYTVSYDKALMFNMFKVRKVAKIRNRYNQAPHLTTDTTWESDKTQLNITNESFPSR